MRSFFRISFTHFSPTSHTLFPVIRIYGLTLVKLFHFDMHIFLHISSHSPIIDSHDNHHNLRMQIVAHSHIPLWWCGHNGEIMRFLFIHSSFHHIDRRRQSGNALCVFYDILRFLSADGLRIFLLIREWYVFGTWNHTIGI